MQKWTVGLISTAALLTGFWVAPSLAEDVSAGKIVNEGEGPALMGKARIADGTARATPVIKADRSATRALQLDDAAVEKAYTLVGRKNDGTVTRQAPGENVIKAIKGEKAGDKRTMLDPASTVDPEFASDEAARAVIGADNRTRVKNTRTHPYPAIGFLSTENSKGEIWTCSAAAIGPRTVITAGHCLYNHEEEGGWRDKFTFWPGINGEKDVPFGGFEYETAYVFEGFITEYNGSYDQVWPYDVGLLTFADPIGDTIGWLGQSASDFADSDFQGNLVGYHDDKPDFTMWKSSCNVIAESVSELDFMHDCDFKAASGAPIYVFDKARKSRDLVGITMGELNDANWALRLYPAVSEWIDTINQ